MQLPFDIGVAAPGMIDLLAWGVKRWDMRLNIFCPAGSSISRINMQKGWC